MALGWEVPFPESAKTIRVVQEGQVDIFCWIWWYPADAGGQMGRHVSQFKGLDRLQ